MEQEDKRAASISKALDLRAYLRAGDWDGLKSSISQMSVHAAHESLRHLAECGGLRAPLGGLAASDQDFLGLTITGAILRYRASRIRGGHLAEVTPDEAMQRYAEVLADALEVLDAALSLRSRDPLAVGFRSSIAVEEDEGGKRTAITRVQEASGDIAAAALGDVLTAWTFKWGMSQPEMWEAFNRLYDPARLSTLALLPQAHWEQQTYHRWFENDGRKAKRYYRSELVRNALAEGSDRALDEAHSADPALLRHIDGWFARVFSDAGNYSRAREHLQRLGRHVNPSIWANGSAWLTTEGRLIWARRRSGLWFW